MPVEMEEFILRKKYNVPSFCYQNCFMYVMDQSASGFKPAVDYVLCRIRSRKDMVWTEHAILHSNGHYYDPTLGSVDMYDYEIIDIWAKDAIEAELAKNYDAEHISLLKRGFLPWPILCEVQKGIIGFEIE